MTTRSRMSPLPMFLFCPRCQKRAMPIAVAADRIQCKLCKSILWKTEKGKNE